MMKLNKHALSLITFSICVLIASQCSVFAAEITATEIKDATHQEFQSILAEITGQDFDNNILFDSDENFIRLLSPEQTQSLLINISLLSGTPLNTTESHPLLCIPFDNLTTQSRWANPAYTWNFETCVWEYDYTQDPRNDRAGFSYDSETGTWVYACEQDSNYSGDPEDVHEGETAMENSHTCGTAAVVGGTMMGSGGGLILANEAGAVPVTYSYILSTELGVATTFYGAVIVAGVLAVAWLENYFDDPSHTPDDGHGHDNEGDGGEHGDDGDGDATPDNDPGNDPGSDGGDWL